MALERRQILWQCERKVPVNILPTWTVGEFRAEIVSQLAKDYSLEEDEVDAELSFNKQILDDDSLQMGQIPDLYPKSVIFVLSRAVANAYAEKGKIRSVSQAFKELFESGEYSKEAEKEALANAQPFPVCGDPMDLGELGAGWPVLFNFIGLLAFLLIALYFCYLPATMLYWAAPPEAILEWPLITGHEDTVKGGVLISAGALGPDGSESRTPAWCAFTGAVLIIVGVFLMELRIKHVKRTVDSNEVDPNDFAIFVQGLPSDATDEQEIKSFFEAYAREDEETPVVQVVIGFDVRKFNQELEDFKVAKQQRTICTDPSERAELDAKYNNFNKLYAHPQALRKNLECTGCAVVVFQYQVDQRECLEQWSSCMDRFVQKFGMESNVNENELFRDEYILEVSRAENPDDILWENLGVAWSERAMAGLKTNAIMTAILLTGCGLIFLIQMSKRDWYADSYWPYWLGAIVIAFTNGGETMIAKQFIDKELHQTTTSRDVGLMNKMTVLYTLNYGFVLFLVNWPPEKDWYLKSGLVADIFSLEVMNAIVYPVFYFCGLAKGIKKCVAKMMDRPELMAGKNQSFLNKLYEAPSMNTPRAYAQILKAWFLGLLYLPLIPHGTLFCGLGLAGYYWGLKYHLLRFCKRPYRQSVVLGESAIQIVEISVMIFGVSQWFFLKYSLTGAGETLAFLIMFVILGAGLASLLSPPGCVGKLLSVCWKQATYTDVDYYSAQIAWPKHQKYHTTNAVYLFMENFYRAMKAKNPALVLPWDPRTGNLSKPNAPPEAPAPTAAAAPEPGKLDGSAEEDLVPTESGISTETGKTEESVETTGPIAAVDPAKLAMEEMKYKIPVELLGAGKDAAESDDDLISTDGEDEEDSEAPLVGTLQEGTKAKISGLTASSAQRFNDTFCTVLAPDPETRKYLVILENDKQARLPYQNIEYAAGPFEPGTKVRIVNLQSLKKYNNTTAEVVSWETETSKYVCKLFTGVKGNLKAINLEYEA
mmetsp:Transcript_128490/g.240402  ORF Transcript_128490/g.240402 Transcript_128490/m.240402 type:complete len:993 (+) Transcript_128490:3-2981(+)